MAIRRSYEGVTRKEPVAVACFRDPELRSAIEDRGDHTPVRGLEMLDDDDRCRKVLRQLGHNPEQRIQASCRRSQSDDTLGPRLAEVMHRPDAPRSALAVGSPVRASTLTVRPHSVPAEKWSSPSSS